MSIIQNTPINIEQIIVNDKIQWKRKCPNCNRDILYMLKSGCVRANKKNSVCLSCNSSINNKRRGAWIGENNPWHGRIRCGDLNPFYKKKHSNKTKEIISSNTIKHKTGTKHSPDTRLKISAALKGISKSPEHREKCIRNGKCGYIEWKRKHGILKSGYNPIACAYFDELNVKFNWNLQHAQNGGEIRCNVYFLDAYDKLKNIVVEYDESYHYDVYGNLKSRDIIRMNYIIKKLNCKFFRYNEEKKLLIEITDNDLKI